MTWVKTIGLSSGRRRVPLRDSAKPPWKAAAKNGEALTKVSLWTLKETWLFGGPTMISTIGEVYLLLWVLGKCYWMAWRRESTDLSMAGLGVAFFLLLRDGEELTW